MDRPTLAVLAFAGLHLAAFMFPESGLWGVDCVAYAPWMAAAFFVAIFLLLFPRVQTVVSQALVWMNDRPWRVAFLPIIALILFQSFPVSRHFLGDGELLLRTFSYNVESRSWGGINAPLPYHLIDEIRHIYPTETVIRTLSNTSGVIYVALAIWLSRTLYTRTIDRSILLGFALTPGFTQLFFGYVETYSLIYPLLLAYLISGLLSLQSRCPLAIPATLMGILIVTHFSLLVLAPSLLMLAVLRWKSEHSSVFRTFLETIVCPIVSFALLLVVSFDHEAYFEGARETHLLPFLVTEGSRYAYGLLSITHLNNIINEYLLVVPAAVFILVSHPKCWWVPRHDHLFLLAAAVSSVFFTLVANPEIGAFRDWDAFAFPALPVALLAGLVTIQQFNEIRSRWTMMVGASAVHVAFWILLNAQPTLADARFANLLETSTLSSTARSYGWESVGSHRRREGDLDGEEHAFTKATEANPSNHRYWNTLGTVAARREQLEEAIGYYAKALEVNPESIESHVNIGGAYHRTGQYEMALHHYVEATRRTSNLHDQFYANMGDAYLMTGQMEQALGAYEEATVRNPKLVRAFFQAANMANRLGDIEKARLYFGEVLRLDPDYEHGDLVRKWITEVDRQSTQEIKRTNPE